MCKPISSRTSATTLLSAGIGLPTFRSHNPYLMPATNSDQVKNYELAKHKLHTKVWTNSQDREKIDRVVLWKLIPHCFERRLERWGLS